MNVLISGGAGYVGGAVAKELFWRGGHQLKVVDALLYEDCYLAPVDFQRLDVRNQPMMLEYLRWADCVIWLAAIVGDGACAHDPQEATEINLNAVDWLSKNFDGRILFPSTCSVYGAQDAFLDENSHCEPLSVYAETKLRAEGCLASKNALILRLGTLFGMGDTYSRIRTDLVVNTMTIRACTDNKITVRGGSQWRPLIHVKDVARVIADQVDSGITGVFNLASYNVQIGDLACLIADHFHQPEIVYEEMPSKDERNYRVDGEKSRSILGFKPQHTLPQGIEEIAAIVRAGRLPDPWHPRFSNERYLRDAKRLMLD